MKDAQLKAIEERYVEGYADIESAAADVGALLTYLDEIAGQVHSLGETVSEALSTSRIVLALRLEADGHAPNLGAALKLAEDLKAVGRLYPGVRG